jgi:hypothetical protein
MAEWVCEQCGVAFTRDKSGSRPIRFCTVRCYHDWRKANDIRTGQFQPGLTPWNKDLKGIHLSPHSEFKKGQRSNNWLPVGTVTERADKQGNVRAWVKVAEPNKWRERAIVNWELFHGRPLPKGKVVHHKDRNTLNDSASNLQALTRAEHITVHRQELLQAKLARAA